MMNKGFEIIGVDGFVFRAKKLEYGATIDITPEGVDSYYYISWDKVSQKYKNAAVKAARVIQKPCILFNGEGYPLVKDSGFLHQKRCILFNVGVKLDRNGWPRPRGSFCRVITPNQGRGPLTLYWVDVYTQRKVGGVW